MRLTLRTLLAYLDDVLDPADKEELGKKIESSEFAEDLMHRTRDTMRRLRLSAPQVVGAGMGLDPNTVAEYLDNSLPPESVGDFERICLESDMHLAEVASCHHVLTMVLGQPADIDPAAKQRMYTIPTELAERKRLRVEAAHVAREGDQRHLMEAGAVEATAFASRGSAKAVEIPEYLRASGWARFRGLMIGLAAMLLVGATVFVVYAVREQFGTGPAPLAEAVTDGGDLEVPANTIAPAPTAPIAGPTLGEPAGETTAPGTSAPSRYVETPAGEPAGSETAAAPPVAPEPTQPSVAGPNVGERYATTSDAASPAPATSDPPLSDTASGRPPIASSPPPTTIDMAANDMAANDSAEAIAARVPPAAIAEPPFVENPEDLAVASTRPGGAAGDLGPDSAAMDTAEDAAAGAGGTPLEVEAANALPLELGTYRGGKSVLLRYDEPSGRWFRATPRSAIKKGERLLALPEFRPMITLATGLHMDLSGGALVKVDAERSTDVETPVLDVAYGRVVLVNVSREPVPVGLVLGPQSYHALLAQNATLALEVERTYVPGNDPRRTPAPMIVRLYVPDGGVTWDDDEGIVTTIDTASEWTIADGEPTAIAASASPPNWIDHEPDPQSSEQRYGAKEIERTLSSERAADVQLLELFESDSRREVKSLVARSGMHVGLFVPFIEALRDSAQRPHWTGQINSLRAAMALGPDSSEKVWQTLVEQRGETAAADLYEMLCGYSAEQVGRTPEQMKTGAVARLIDWLGAESLDYRVLAVHDLWEITGKQLMSNPAASVQERGRNIRLWRERLNEGELTSRVGQ